jgi:hypothetical protein
LVADLPSQKVGDKHADSNPCYCCLGHRQPGVRIADIVYLPMHSGLKVRQGLIETALVSKILQTTLLYLVDILVIGNRARRFRDDLPGVAFLNIDIWGD